MGLQAAFSGHLVLFCVPGWGHLRPLCSLSSRVVLEHPDVAVTLLMMGEYRPQMEREISRYFPVNSPAKTNIRLVNICGESLEPFSLSPIIFEEFPRYYDKLVNCKPVQCLETRRTFDAMRKPTAVVLDFFLLPILRYIRSVSGKSIPVFAWIVAYASSTLHIMGPEKFGGFGDVVTKAHTEAAATGRKLEDIIEELYHPSIGNLINVPGLPPMYDYEWSPQELTPEVPQSDLFAASYNFACECDGFVSVSNGAYEPESLDAMRSWLRETNRPVYAMGPLVPPGFGDGRLSDIAKQMEVDSSKNGGEFQTFLDKTLQSHGQRSLIYVAFGSFWWPKRNEHVWVVVDVLLELGFPFILSQASPKAAVPPRYAEKIQRSGIGLLSTWCPQQTILNHPATGWILTHCGQNSVTEALAQGIPLIAWPLDADQPANAAYLTLSLDVAFEMVEVRTGLGLKPLYRGVQPTGTVEAITAEARSILHRARGPEGDRKRRNAQSVQYKWKNEWEDGGEALNNLRKFVTDNSQYN